MARVSRSKRPAGLRRLLRSTWSVRLLRDPRLFSVHRPIVNRARILPLSTTAGIVVRKRARRGENSRRYCGIDTQGIVPIFRRAAVRAGLS